jgi:hypothetical protein
MRTIEVSDADVIAVGAAGVTAGAAPILGWLKIAELVIDDDYQRDLKPDNWRRIRKIADRFRWSRFSPVFVSPIEGGRYAVIDGQHRTHAAAICGFTEVPCQIVQMTREEQAASFAAVNGMVTKVTGYQILKAAIVAGEGWAIRAAKICEDGGCRLMTYPGSTGFKKPGEIYPIALIRKLAAEGRAEAMSGVLRALRASRFGSTADAYANDILKPLFLAVIDRPAALSDPFDLTAFLDRFDFHGALDRAADFVKRKRREGIVGVASVDIVAGELRDAIDKSLAAPAATPPSAKNPAVERKAGGQPAVAPSLDGASRVRLKNTDGRYLNRYGTGFTDKADVAWIGTKERAERALAAKPDFRTCVMEAAD